MEVQGVGFTSVCSTVPPGLTSDTRTPARSQGLPPFKQKGPREQELCHGFVSTARAGLAHSRPNERNQKWTRAVSSQPLTETPLRKGH